MSVGKYTRNNNMSHLSEDSRRTLSNVMALMVSRRGQFQKKKTKMYLTDTFILMYPQVRLSIYATQM